MLKEFTKEQGGMMRYKDDKRANGDGEEEDASDETTRRREKASKFKMPTKWDNIDLTEDTEPSSGDTSTTISAAGGGGGGDTNTNKGSDDTEPLILAAEDEDSRRRLRQLEVCTLLSLLATFFLFTFIAFASNQLLLNSLS